MHQQLAYNDVLDSDHELCSPRHPEGAKSQLARDRVPTSESQIPASATSTAPAIARPSSKARSVKSVNSNRTPSRRRDAARSLDYQTFAQDRLGGRHGVAVVYKGVSFFSSSHHEGENDKQKDDDVLDDLLSGTAGAPTSIVTSFPHWSAQWIGHPTTHRTCAEWRDLSDYMELDASFYAALEAGQVYAFSLHLNDANETKAREADDAADWICRRLNLRLGKAQKVVLFAVAVEDRTSEKKHALAFDRADSLDRRKKALLKLLRDDRRVHVHGFIVVADHEMTDVKKALKLAGGVGFGRGRQLMLTPVYSVGWASYMMKNAHFSSQNLHPYISGTRWAPGFRGPVMKISGPLRRLAKTHYEAFRAAQSAKTGRKPRASKASRKPSFRWMTDVRALLGSTALTPLATGAPFQSKSMSSTAASGAPLPVSRALWVPSKVSVMRPVARASRCARRRARIVARHAVGRQVNGFVRQAA